MKFRWLMLSPRAKLAIKSVAGVLVVWMLASAVLLAQARAGVQSGVDKLESTDNELTAEALLSGRGRATLVEAADDFAAAYSSASSPVLAPWDFVPLVGQQTRAADALTAAALEVAEAAERARAASAEIVSSSPKSGADRLAMLERLGAIAAQAEQDLSDIELGSDFLLAQPIADARDSFIERLRKLRGAVADASALADGAAQLLRGPRRYLVLAANNAEMRSGSGMLLSVGIATFAGGEFELSEMRPSTDYNPAPGRAIPVPEELQRIWGWVQPTTDWRSLATSPRFDATAALAADMWRASTGDTVDGVLVVDAMALRALVAAQGSIDAAGRTLSPDDVLWFLLVGQYMGLEAGSDHEGRRDELSAVARAAVDTLQTRPWDTGKLVGRLSEAGRGRHVLAWARDPTEQKAWQAGGIAGTLGYDSLLISVLNFGGNKLDDFLEIQARLDTGDGGADTTAVTVHMTIRNTAPDDLPGYVQGPNTPSTVGAGVYQGVVAANVPGGATEITLEGAGELVGSGPDGPTQMRAAGYFQVPRGGQLEVTLRFRLPPGVTSMEIEPSARVPAITWAADGKTFKDYARERVEW